MKIRKQIIVCLVVMIMGSIFTGCDIKTDTPLFGRFVGLDDGQIFQINDLICTRAEYMLVLMNYQNEWKKKFGEATDWEVKPDDHLTLKEVVARQTKEEITIRYAFAAMGYKNGITLSKDEESHIADIAKKFYDSMNEDEKQYTGATQSDVTNLYTNYYLADKQREKLVGDIGSDLSDEQARVIKIQYIHMNAQTTNHKKIIATLKNIEMIVKGKYQDFAREAKQYSLDDSIEVILKKNDVNAKYEQEAFQLNTGQMSKIIQDGDDYYLVYCVDGYMKKETEENKNNIIESEKQNKLQEQYNLFLKNASLDMNTAALNQLQVSDNTNVATTQLFSEW